MTTYGSDTTMVNRPKQIGTAGETAVTRAARTRGFPNADRLTLTGNKDRGDIGLCPGVIVEVKAGEAARRATDQQVAKWLLETETERRNANADVGLLVTARTGIGAPNAHRWACHMWTSTFLTILGAPHLLELVPDPYAPIRMTFESALALLRSAGYGDPEGNTP